MNTHTDRPREQTPTTTRPRGMAVLFLLTTLIVFLGVFVGLGTSQNSTAASTATPRQLYLNILAEPRTGLRLARLNSFLQTAPHSPLTASARIQSDVLAQHEKRAWSRFTHALYSVRLAPQAKQQALKRYIATWGVWTRKAEIAKARQKLRDLQTGAASKPPAQTPVRRSQFSSGPKEAFMAGAPIGAAPPRVILYPAKVEKPQPVAVQDVRVKSIKRPHYPGAARRNRVEGRVVLSLDIDERGHVARTRVVSISAPRYQKKFIRSAKHAARRARFYPKTVNGHPVARPNYLRAFTFKLEE